jgi:hypothetical protein
MEMVKRAFKMTQKKSFESYENEMIPVYRHMQQMLVRLFLPWKYGHYKTFWE